MRARLATLPSGRHCSLSHASRGRVERCLHAPTCIRRLHLCEERIELLAQRFELALTGASKIPELVERDHNGFWLIIPCDHYGPTYRLLEQSTELVLRISRGERRHLDFLAAAVGPVRWEGGFVDVLIGLATMVLATALFLGALRIRPWSVRFPRVQRLLERKYYFDELYNAAFVRSLDATAEIGLRDIEEPVIDAAVVNSGWITRASATSLSFTQSGYFRNYVLVFVGGAVVAAAIILLRAS